MNAMRASESTGNYSSHGAPLGTGSTGNELVGRSIGHIIRELRQLDGAQMEQILRHQQEHNTRFGDAAVALKLATNDDVLWALSQQFHYPYAPGEDVQTLSPELITARDPFSEVAEIFRDVRSQLMMGVLAAGVPRAALAVLSPKTGDGKSFFAANLAITFSQLGGRTVLIDADMRTPRLHSLFDLQGKAGLSNILAGRADAHVVHEMPNLPGLFVLPVGTLPPNPLELLQRPQFPLLLQELLAKFDTVLVDTPAASHGADARVLASKCGAALIIGRRGTTKMRDVQTLVTQVTKAKTQLAGVLLNEY